MNLALIIGFFVLFSPQSLWAVPVLDKTDSSVTSNISSEELQNLPLNQRNYQSLIKLLPTADNNNFTQNDISGAQVKLRDDLKFITDANRQPANLDNSLKEYLSHLPQDTQQIIDKIGSFKSNPGNFYGRYDFAKFNNPRVWNIYPQEMPKISAFTPQEQIWQKNNISFGRLGISEMNHQWNFGLATYNKNNWEWRPSYKLGESYGINGPIIAYTKTPKGPDLSIYSADGYFVGDVTRAKLKADPYVTVKYIIKARYYGSFGRPHPYDRFIPISGYVPYNVMVLPYGRSLGDDFQVAKFIDNRFTYSDSFYDEDDDCDDEDYYYYHEDECDVFYHYCIAPFLVERIRTRTILANVKDPNDAFFPSLKPKKKSGGSFFSGLISVITPVGVILPSDTSNGGEVNIIDQYSLPQIGFTDKSNPDSAWNVVDTKGPNVVVAVIDSGVDLSHPDGPEFIWQNPEDGTHGWNFLDENSDITDQRGHGTMIAGIIAAKTNNGMGIAGINPGAVIMPLKVADKKGYANSLNIYRAIHFAVDHGARVINISLGALGVSELENLAINYARSHNVLVVVASGNSKNDIGTSGPASSGSAIAVGALNYDGTLATVSNWGANNSLMAPGEQIFSLHSKDAPWDGPAGQRERLYTKESGTSFSAPMVAATASLMLVKNPDLTVNQLEDILLSTAKPLDKERWNGLTGAGLLDAAKALRANPQDTFDVKITKVKSVYNHKKLEFVDVYATVRGAVDYFTVEVGRGKNAHGFSPVMGICAQEANDDLVAHITNDKLRGSNDWVLLVRALDKSGKEYQARTALTIK